MPLQKIQLRPGTNRENTNYANEGGWYVTNKVRFRSGQPEKIGGWTKDTGTVAATLAPSTGTIWGVVRSMWNWLNLAAYNLLGLGTNLKYYIQSNTNSTFNDITPIRKTTSALAGFTTSYPTNASRVQVTDPGHGAQTGDFVTVSATSGTVNGISATIMNAEYQITYINSNSYYISLASGAATSAGTSAVTATFTYQINTGSDIFTYGTGFGAGAWGGTIVGVATTALNGAINNSTTTITVTSTTGFSTTYSPSLPTILIDSETISYTGTTATTFTGCTRGVGSPGAGAAASHLTGAAVVQSSTGTASTSYVGWGQPATIGIGTQLRLWSQSNFGENLVINPRGGALYYWVVSASPSTFTRAQQLISTNTNTQTTTGTSIPYAFWQTDIYCPTVSNFVLVSDASRFVIAFGVNDYGATQQDPLLVRWSDQENILLWYPAVTNQAGSYRLSRGSTIITAIQTRQEILVLTDAAIYSMQYLGPPYVWGFQILGDNISIAGPKAIATANNITYWMGLDKFYMYTGRVETLPSTLREYVYTDINLTQSFQFNAGTNEGYNEVWWSYCSLSGPSGTGTSANPNTVIDRYVIFNYLDNVWYYGDWINYTGTQGCGRTAWLDSSLRAYPMACVYGSAGGTSNANLVYHESGVDDGAYSSSAPVPIVTTVQSSDFDIGDGNNFGFVWRLIPDVTFDGSSMTNLSTAYPSCYFTVVPRAFPGAAYGSSNNPAVTSTQSYSTARTYAIQQFTQQVYVRIRGRQMSFQVSSGTTGSTTDGLGVQWQLGAPRIDIRPDGRR